jgi:hypothetical protein
MGGNKWWLAALMMLALSACGREPPAPSVATDGAPATGSVEQQLLERFRDFGEVRYFQASTDLDGDGQDELVIHVAGPMVCGTGGCNTLVFTPADGRWTQIADITVSRPPIRASERRTNGWRNLLVRVAGGGLPESYNAELRFDGETYPGNPTVPPAERAEDVEGATVLIDAFDSFEEGRPLSSP